MVCISRVALGLSLLCRCLGQNRFVSEIPAKEKATLEQIVEDNPAPPRSDLEGGSDWESPVYNQIYSNPLPVPPVKQPTKKIVNPVTGKEIWYYELEIKSFTQQVYPGLKPARLVGYDGISPGPTFIVPRGTETVVRILNNAQIETSVHLHGSPSRAPFDGWAEDITNPGQYKDYYWPNNQNARFLWYHDHAMHVTAENAYFGQAGCYIITDPGEDALGLPSGYGQFDIPLALTSKFYNADGTLRSTEGEDDSLWGDVIHVNGQPWPYFNVQPRKYRFRFLNAAVSRSFALYFAKSSAVNTKLPFKVIASDAGLLQNSVTASDLYISMGERYEVVFDFSQFAGQTLELRNLAEVNGIGTDEDFAATNKVMKFVVSKTPVSDPSIVPPNLRTVPFPPASTGIDHHFRFHRTDSEWRINNVGFADVQNRILANVPRGKVEIWELENGSGGWTHPIHVHLVDFRVLSRTNADNGRQVLPYESAGLKDVVWLARHETVLVEAHYAPWNGVYMFHCHNLIHEDQDMMAAFNVSALANFGYTEVTDFADPMDQRWRARPYAQSDYTSRTGPFSDQSITDRVKELAQQQPYSELSQVESALDDYWAQNKKRSADDCEKPATGPIPRYRRFVV
ncbi:bilirubin oxidase [Westerdykella ornata]|uniref:Bilirubin oxidase n=1 Tax=Westerdykella ornata TaxID=318751 RepID=A0A6A6JG26_WESOR|nr:bilirubin oxidase [Westerdykella ornata]KAF2275287.1 bilirubin oxidase [Westerdykella ornata]